MWGSNQKHTFLRHFMLFLSTMQPFADIPILAGIFLKNFVFRKAINKLSTFDTYFFA